LTLSGGELGEAAIGYAKVIRQQSVLTGPTALAGEWLLMADFRRTAIMQLRHSNAHRHAL